MSELKEITCRNCGGTFKSRARRWVCNPCQNEAYQRRNSPEAIEAEKARRKLPSLTPIQVDEAVQQGKRWFTNGGKRWRYVEGFEGYWILFSNGKDHYISGVNLHDFADWAKFAYSNEERAELLKREKEEQLKAKDENFRRNYGG